MQITTTPLLAINDTIYMVLKSYQIDTATLPIQQAKVELHNIMQSQPDANATWGYFPEIADNDHQYPASQRLASAMETIMSDDPRIPSSSVDLAFVRLATSEPESSFGGFHVDVNPGVAHAWTPDVPKDSNILRVLFNVYDEPRKLEFYPYLVQKLRADGYDIPAEHYKILNFPKSLKTTTIEIPPIEKNRVYCLQFLSNLIPHAGRTYAEGHFLVSFGGYISPQLNPFAP
jgi:hypothetical protein